MCYVYKWRDGDRVKEVILAMGVAATCITEFFLAL